MPKITEMTSKASEPEKVNVYMGRLKQPLAKVVVHNDRAANGGKLTQQERAQVNHQQNNVSK